MANSLLENGMESKVITTFRVFLVERKIRPKQTESLKT